MGQLANIEQQLANAGSLKAALSMDFVQKTFINNYEKITGNKDGESKFQEEVFALMELANENPNIARCTRFSMFAALVKAGATGLSFRDQRLYAIPYGDTLKVQISTHGKRELMSRMPDVKRVYEAQCVVRGDTFEHDKINNKVVLHVGKNANPLTIDNILASYVRIEFRDKSVIDVVVYAEDIKAAKSKSKAQNGPWKDFPGEMAKKVAYNRAYKLYYQRPENITDFANETDGETDDADFSVVTESGEKVDGGTGEIQQPVQEAQVEKTPPAKDEDSFM